MYNNFILENSVGYIYYTNIVAFNLQTKNN